VEGVYSGSSCADEGLFAAVDTVSVESFGHVNVDDVDTGGLCLRNRFLDRAIQGSRRVVDLGLEGQVRIDKLEQE
jgi:hypothetical protein